jgi:hypothetical protein
MRVALACLAEVWTELLMKKRKYFVRWASQVAHAHQKRKQQTQNEKHPSNLSTCFNGCILTLQVRFINKCQKQN